MIGIRRAKNYYGTSQRKSLCTDAEDLKAKVDAAITKKERERRPQAIETAPSRVCGGKAAES
jgi:hypothetical protein